MVKYLFYIFFYQNLIFYIITLNLSVLLSFFRLLSTFVDVLKVAKTLTFETSLISLSTETGVFPKPIAIE
jgi:hypothetical protein